MMGGGRNFACAVGTRMGFLRCWCECAVRELVRDRARRREELPVSPDENRLRLIQS